jgi:hypothetical protein
MVNFNECVENIKDNHGFKHNSHDDSFYRTYIVEGGQFLQLRVSNHGTHLWTWLEKDYDPSVALANISIVFTQDGRWESNTAVDMGDKKRSYSIIQYIYNCSVLDDNDILRINNRIQDIVTNRGYLDPLSDNETKKAQVYTLEPNQEPKQIIQENKQTTNINKNMKKQTIKLNESQLRNIIKESIKNTLNEGIGGRVYDNLEQAHKLLADVISSKLIAFTSPSPSSTELELKKTTIEAARLIDKALYLCGQLGYNGAVHHIV